MNIKNTIEIANKIFDALNDEKSKYIFKERLLYSFTSNNTHAINIIETVPEGKRLVELIKKDEDIYIFGAGTWGKEIVQVWPDRWQGFLDNNAENWGKYVCGVQVYNPKEIINEDFSGKVIISTRIYYKEIYKQLINMGLHDENIVNVGEMLDDLADKQYFDLSEIKYDDEEVFADVGSLDAMSAIRFHNWSGGNFKKIYCFEPDPSNVPKCKKNLKDYGIDFRTEIVEKGAWSSEGVISFMSEGNGTSAFVLGDDNAEVMVDVVTLDSVLKDKKITFIKMDIEGAEIEALKGCEDIIRNQKPKLAICIYHKPEDVLEIPNLILTFNPNYKLYIRHYSVAAAETVLYAL